MAYTQDFPINLSGLMHNTELYLSGITGDSNVAMVYNKQIPYNLVLFYVQMTLEYV